MGAREPVRGTTWIVARSSVGGTVPRSRELRIMGPWFRGFSLPSASTAKSQPRMTARWAWLVQWPDHPPSTPNQRETRHGHRRTAWPRWQWRFGKKDAACRRSVLNDLYFAGLPFTTSAHHRLCRSSLFLKRPVDGRGNTPRSRGPIRATGERHLAGHQGRRQPCRARGFRHHHEHYEGRRGLFRTDCTATTFL